MRFESKLLFSFLIIIFQASAFAGRPADSTNPKLLVINQKAMQQEPETDSTRTITAQLDPNANQAHSCPSGYALTSVYQLAQSRRNVTVYRECNGVGSGYVHVWCGNKPDTYNPIDNSPSVKYTCTKILNRWVQV